jgi:hypothetical protein
MQHSKAVKGNAKQQQRLTEMRISVPPFPLSSLAARSRVKVETTAQQA